LSKKLRDRVHLLNSSQISSIIDPRILPKEHGGEVPCKEMMERFKKTIQERLEMLRGTDAISVDAAFVKMHAGDFESDTGSFRKLEID
jgi:hypothetical protein